MFFDGGKGHARIGRIVSYSPADGTVLREVEAVYAGDLDTARRGWGSGGIDPDPATRGMAAGGVEGETAHRLAVADNGGDHRDHRRRHFGKGEARSGELRLERDRGLADVDDAH